MPITALLELTIKPESLADAPAVIHQTLQATRAFEGCLGVDVLMDADNPAHIVLLERWDSSRVTRPTEPGDPPRTARQTCGRSSPAPRD